MKPPFSRVVPVAALACLLALLGSSAPQTLAAHGGPPPRECSLRTLRGDYGLVGTGTRVVGPGGPESFVTLAMVRYDGHGSFTAVGVSHGETTGVRENPVSGTYYVNPDCTGGQTTVIPVPGVPPIEDRFVIVDGGREIRTVVVSPDDTIGTANLRKK